MSEKVDATRTAEHVLVTGGTGYVGSRLMGRLLDDQNFTSATITAVDSRRPSSDAAWAAGPRVRVLTGDFTDPGHLDRTISSKPDLVFHLAGALGGAAEADYSLARAVNVDGSLSIFEALCEHSGRPPRIVYASSIAVFGPPLPDLVDDARQRSAFLNTVDPDCHR